MQRDISPKDVMCCNDNTSVGLLLVIKVG